MAIFRKGGERKKIDAEESLRIDKMRRQYYTIRRVHPKTNPDFRRMAHDSQYRLQMLADMPDK